jgi:dTDP-glucose 4,6-dehydratase
MVLQMKKVVYVTGCLGFIGYHVAKACLERGWYVHGIDKCTYAANLNLLDSLNSYGQHFKFTVQDINDLTSLYDCDYIINTAAETHVDNSIESSDVFLKSNVNGVHRLLELIKLKPKSRRPILFHFSTDEVYGDIEIGFHIEKDLLKPSNPYAATKAAADMLVLAWARTYDIPYVIVRPTNNYGIGQYVEKFIPKACKNLTLGKPIVLHDKGLPRRTWLSVEDTANAILKIIDSKITNEIFNISGNYEEQNIVVARKIINNFFGHVDYENYLDKSEVRPGQDVRYAIDDNKLRNLGWQPNASFDKDLKLIIDWYKQNFIW